MGLDPMEPGSELKHAAMDPTRSSPRSEVWQ